MDIESLVNRARWVRIETIKLHGLMPETRLASSLSCVEILCALFYGGLIRHDPRNPAWDGRDRFIISKGHGSISFYPILADLGFFPTEELNRIGKKGGILKAIPDTFIPGYETINGSVGQGLGTACGMALGLRCKFAANRVFVLCGDGELQEGAMWEAIMFAAKHKLDNLTVIIDDNKRCMLGESRDFIELDPLEEKFHVFGWETAAVDGHNPRQVVNAISALLGSSVTKPRALIARTVKGKGVRQLECDPMSHIRSLKAEDVQAAIAELS